MTIIYHDAWMSRSYNNSKATAVARLSQYNSSSFINKFSSAQSVDKASDEILRKISKLEDVSLRHAAKSGDIYAQQAWRDAWNVLVREELALSSQMTDTETFRIGLHSINCPPDSTTPLGSPVSSLSPELLAIDVDSEIGFMEKDYLHQTLEMVNGSMHDPDLQLDEALNCVSDFANLLNEIIFRSDVLMDKIEKEIFETFASSTAQDHGDFGLDSQSEIDDEVLEDLSVGHAGSASSYFIIDTCVPVPLSSHMVQRQLKSLCEAAYLQENELADLIDQLENEVLTLDSKFRARVSSNNQDWISYCSRRGISPSSLSGKLSDMEHQVYLQVWKCAYRDLTNALSKVSGQHVRSESRISNLPHQFKVSLVLQVINRMRGNKNKAMQDVKGVNEGHSTDDDESKSKSSHLPILSPQHILAHHEWYSACTSFLRNKVSSAFQYKNDKHEFWNRAKSAIKALQGRIQYHLQMEAEHNYWARVCQASRQRYEEAKSAKAVADALTSMVEAEILEAEKAMHDAARELRLQRAEKIRGEVMKYKQDLELRQKRMDAIHQFILKENAQREKEKIAEGMKRVEYREQLRKERREKLEALLAEQASLVEERNNILEKIIASVPYADKLSKISEERNLDRLQGHTESSRIAEEFSRAYLAFLNACSQPNGGGAFSSRDNLDFVAASGHARELGGVQESEKLMAIAGMRMKERGLFINKGFTDKQITSNRGFRLVTALRSSNVQSAAARQAAMMAYKPVGRGALAQSKMKSSHEW